MLVHTSWVVDDEVNEDLDAVKPIFITLIRSGRIKVNCNGGISVKVM
jgi:hypothetical protein